LRIESTSLPPTPLVMTGAVEKIKEICIRQKDEPSHRCQHQHYRRKPQKGLHLAICEQRIMSDNFCTQSLYTLTINFHWDCRPVWASRSRPLPIVEWNKTSLPICRTVGIKEEPTDESHESMRGADLWPFQQQPKRLL
jgi:hypothetical protein